MIKRNKFLIIFLLLGGLMMLGLFIFLAAYSDLLEWDGSSYGCRGDVMSQLPIYPKATLVKKNEGNVHNTSYYETMDHVQDIADFYDCQVSANGVDLMNCWHTLHGDFDAALYEVHISDSSEIETKFYIDTTWRCGMD